MREPPIAESRAEGGEEEGPPSSVVGFIDESAATSTRSGVAKVGRGALDLAQSTLSVYSVFVRTLYFSVKGDPQGGAILRQMFEIGNRSLLFLCVVMGFIGMILIYQAGIQTLRLIPDLSRLGATFLQLLVSELGPTICALMLATRVGAGIAAEIGSMVVTEQVDALRMCAADPVDYLIRPRFVASLVMTAVLVVVASTVSYAAGAVTAQVFFQVNPRTYLNLSMVEVGDVVIGLTKCVAYGAAIPTVSGWCGLNTFGGSEGVGHATTQAVVSSSLVVIMLDFFLSVAGFLVFK